MPPSSPPPAVAQRPASTAADTTAVRPRRLVRGRDVWALVVGLIGGLLGWTLESLAPRAGLDQSWQTGMNMASKQGLEFGPELLYTYGPLGYFAAPLSIAGPPALAAAFLYMLLTSALVAGFLFRRFDDAFRNTPVAAALALVVTLALAAPPPDVAVVAAAVMGIDAFLSGTARRPAAMLLALSVLAAVTFLVKPSTGVVVLGVAVAVALGKRWWSGVALAGASFVCALIVSWLAAGEKLDNLREWLAGTSAVISGYRDAMAGSTADSRWASVAALVTTVLIVVALRRAVSPLPRAEAAGLSLVVAGVTAFSLQQGFIMGAHTPYFFTPALVMLLALQPRVSRPLPALSALVAAVFYVISTQTSPLVLFDPARPLLNAVKSAQFLASEKERARVEERARPQVQGAYAIPEGMLAKIGADPVHVQPVDTSIAWAYNLTWRPLPLFQDYVAYTHELDLINARAVKSPEAPTWILRHKDKTSEHACSPPVCFGARNRLWDPPTTQLAILCNYSIVDADSGWQLLRRLPGSVCGAPTRVSRVEASPGHQVSTPDLPAGTALLAVSIESHEGLRFAVRSRLFKPKQPLVVSTDRGPWRLPRDLGRGLLVVDAPPMSFLDTGDPEQAPGHALRVSHLSVNADATITYYRIPLLGPVTTG